MAVAPKLKIGEVNATYPVVAFTAKGGTQPYQWTVAGGAIPPGMNLGFDGSLNGVPSTAGNFKFTVQVADSGSSTATVSAAMSVRPALSAAYTGPCSVTCNVEQGCVTVCGAFGTVAGGVGPYTYTLISNTPPAGTSLASNALSLKGTFSAIGSAQFTAEVTDSYGETAALSPIFQIFPHLSLASGATCVQSTQTLPCTVALRYSGGTPSVGVALRVNSWAGGQCNGVVPTTCPAPPISAVAGSNVVTVTISQPATGNTQPTGTFTVSIVDQDACGAGSYCTSGTVQIVIP